MEAAIENGPLSPLPYQQAVVDYLKREEPQVWAWFAETAAPDKQADSVRLDLLKTTYRVQRETKPELYQLADAAAAALGLDVPVTLYQAQNAVGLNAALAYIPGEAHLVFAGPVSEHLSEPELRALLGHELAHLLLWEGYNGDFLVADRVLAAMTNDARAEDVHITTARHYALYGEIFCDRGALRVANDPRIAVSMLVKVETQLKDVSAESYIQQAEEIFAQGTVQTDGITHPECYVRARALQRWSEVGDKADPDIQQMIEGSTALDQLDLLGQIRVADWTRDLIDLLVTPRWFQSERVLAHARRFFDAYGVKTDTDAATLDAKLNELKSAVAGSDAAIQDYLCYVMLDFVTVDRDLDEAPLAAACQLAERLELRDRFLEKAHKEMRLGKKQLAQIEREAERVLATAASQHVETEGQGEKKGRHEERETSRHGDE